MIALTGGTGFIGSYLTERMPGVRRLVRDPAKVRERLDLGGDLFNQDDVHKFLDGVDCLLHFASVNHPRSSDRDIVSDIQLSLIPTVKLFETFSSMNPNGHIIFASTGGAIYDPELPYTARVETDLVLPWSAYGVQKLAAENYLRLICRRTGVSGTVLRISNPYGVLLPKQRGHGLIGIAVSAAIHDQTLPILGSGEVVRDYLHLDDLVEAIRKCIQMKTAAGHFELFNIGYGVGYSVNNIIKIIEEKTGHLIQTQLQSSENIICPWNVLNIEKAKKVLNWSPKTNLEEGISRLIQTLDLQSGNGSLRSPVI